MSRAYRRRIRAERRAFLRSINRDSLANLAVWIWGILFVCYFAWELVQR